MNSVADVWDNVLQQLKKDLSETTISTWFDELEAVDIQGNTFILMLKPFFADRLASNPQNLSLLRGVIAEIEGLSPEEVTLKIEKATDATQSARDELENLFS